MKTFADNAGRTWTVSVTVDAVKRVRSLAGVDLLAAIDGELIQRLVADPVLLCDALFAIVKPEADAKGVSDEDFGRAMAGDVIDHATTAFLEELTGFFPLARRQVLSKALGKLRELEQRAVKAANARLDSPELEAEVERILTRIGGSSGTVPGSSGSTPGH